MRSRSRRLSRAMAHQSAAIEHDDTVSHVDEFVELRRDQQHAGASATCCADLAVHRLDRTDVEATCRLCGEQEHQTVRADLAAQNGLLLVAAGQAAEGHVGPGGAHVEAFHQFQGRAAQRGAVEQAEALETVEPVQRQVLGQAHAGDAAHSMAVFGHHADACGGKGLRCRPGHVLPAHEEAAVAGRRHTRQCGRQFRLAVAFDASHADDLAAVDDQREIGEPRRAFRVDHGQAVDLQRLVGGWTGCLGGGDLVVRAAMCAGRHRTQHRAGAGGQTVQIALDHCPHQLRHLLCRRRRMRHHTAAAQHCDTVCHLLDLGQLVRHQHHAAALGRDALGKLSSRPSISAGSSTAVGSSSTSSRGSRIRHLTISTRWRSPTDRSSMRACGSSAQTVVLDDSRLHAARVVLALEHAADLAKHQVLDHRHARHQAEVLVDHGDAVRQRLAPGPAGGAARRRTASGRLSGW